MFESFAAVSENADKKSRTEMLSVRSIDGNKIDIEYAPGKEAEALAEMLHLVEEGKVGIHEVSKVADGIVKRHLN